MNAAYTEGTSALSRYFADIRNCRPLGSEQELNLARRVRRGEHEAMNELVEANLAFVVKVAMEYREILPLEDLLGEGNLGLIQAARRFDAGRGCKFITYAMWWIRKSILSALSRHNVVRVPGYHRKRMREIRDLERALEARLGRPPARDELRAEMNGRRGRLDEALRLDRREVSLDLRLSPDDDLTLADRLADGSACPEQDLIREQDRDHLREALGALGEQEREVITHRYGLDGGPALTLNDVGRRMGLSRERIRQIESQGKKKLWRLVVRRRAGSRRLHPGTPPARPVASATPV